VNHHYTRIETKILWPEIQKEVERRLQKPVSVNYIQNVYRGVLSSKKIKAILDELLPVPAAYAEKPPVTAPETAVPS
jgi:hypothetical protein